MLDGLDFNGLSIEKLLLCLELRWIKIKIVTLGSQRMSATECMKNHRDNNKFIVESDFKIMTDNQELNSKHVSFP
jgi:hypothetical protein